MKEIIISVKEVETNKTIYLMDLEIEDLFDGDYMGEGSFVVDSDAEDLIFNIEHFSNHEKNIRLLECKNCRLGNDLYLFIFNNKMTMFTVCETSYIVINENKIKLFGWDTYVNISLKSGKIKETETR